MHSPATHPSRRFLVKTPKFLGIDVALTAHFALSRAQEYGSIFRGGDVEEELSRRIGLKEQDTFCLMHDAACFRKELGVGVRIAGFLAVCIQISRSRAVGTT